VTRRLTRPPRAREPQTVESVSEKEEELPAVTDCTTLALVDAVQSNPASSLEEENQDRCVEPKDYHEGTCSAASPAQIEKSSTSTSAIADQKIEPSPTSAELMTENSGGEVKANHEAIVARANARRAYAETQSCSEFGAESGF
jgi:hypothetical protein